MIRTFRCKDTERLFKREVPKRFRSIGRAALRKLIMIEAANRIDDLKVPPGNRFERLQGSRAGQWSIRVNDQWRVCFRWEGGSAFDVEIVDYH